MTDVHTCSYHMFVSHSCPVFFLLSCRCPVVVLSLPGASLTSLSCSERYCSRSALSSLSLFKAYRTFYFPHKHPVSGAFFVLFCWRWLCSKKLSCRFLRSILFSRQHRHEELWYSERVWEKKSCWREMIMLVCNSWIGSFSIAKDCFLFTLWCLSRAKHIPSGRKFPQGSTWSEWNHRNEGVSGSNE